MSRALLERWVALTSEARYSALELAKRCNLSERQLQRDFRRELGYSPQEWLDEQRMIAAQQLLLSGHSVKEVSFELGFRQVSHFCRKFKALTRMTPKEFTARGSATSAQCR